MLSGRHFLLLGALASAGLLSVRDGQRQVKLGYRIADIETRLREVKSEIELERARLLVIRTPARALDRARTLRLGVGPPSDLALYGADPTGADERRNRTPPSRDAGSPRSLARVDAAGTRRPGQHSSFAPR
jgi:hypothetical protein